MASLQNLWPKEVAAMPAQRSPGAILREQAALLGPRVNNLLEGRVETGPHPHDTKFHHSFKIVVPALDFYQYELFSLSHGVKEFYPLDAVAHGKGAHLKTEAELVEWLRAVFASHETKRIIGTLLAMVEPPAGGSESQLTLDQL
jgi:hypothetical protein